MFDAIVLHLRWTMLSACITKPTYMILIINIILNYTTYKVIASLDETQHGVKDHYSIGFSHCHTIPPPSTPSRAKIVTNSYFSQQRWGLDERVHTAYAPLSSSPPPNDTTSLIFVYLRSAMHGPSSMNLALRKSLLPPQYYCRLNPIRGDTHATRSDCSMP